MPAVHHVILDTDIGSDVDDAMALSAIIGMPEIALEGVTTVYGDTLLRARLAQRYAGLAGASAEVVVGLSEPLSQREIWWPGHEGSLHPDLEREAVREDITAPAFLVEAVAAAPGEVDVIAIGPLTNIAVALDDPRFAPNLRHLWIMGGAFDRTDSEHNLRSDSTAAQRVFDSGIPITVVPLDVTERVRIERDQLDRIGAAGPLGAALLADIEQWWRYWNVEWNVPHDPLVPLALARPELFHFSAPGRVEILSAADDDGISRFVEDPAGNVRLVVDLDHVAAASAIIDAICTSGEGAAAG